MAEAVLSDAALGRATLARQLLLERSPLDAVAVARQVVSLQAQFARPVHAGLWTRMAAPGDVHALVAEGALVRATMMRHTLHLVAADDYLALRRVVQPGVARAFESMAGRRVAGADREALLAAAADRFAAGPATMKEIRALLVAMAPGGDEAALGYLARTFTEIVQAPAPGSRWGWAGSPQYVLPRDLLGADPQPDPDPAPLVRRYLAAFGPATVADAQTWSGLSGLGAVVAGMDDLVRFRAADGRELVDLPDAPRPDPLTPAPPRLLPEYDNVVLAHADRTRLMTDAHRRRVSLPASRVLPSFLVDGRVAGTWAVAVASRVATLTLAPFARLDAADRAALIAEAEGMVRLLEPAAADWSVAVAAAG